MSPTRVAENVAENGAAVDFAELTAAQVFDDLATSQQGLTRVEAAARLRRYGLNRPPRPRRTRWLVEFGRQFVHLFAVLLWAAALLAVAADMPQLAVAVVVVILINGLFSYIQQYRAEHAVEALEAILPRRVTVRRDGGETVISADEVALGDLIVLGEGSAVPADARLVEAERLRLDMSALTGESRPVSRSAEPCTIREPSPTQITNVVLAGTFVASGRGEAVVFATGAQTEFGRLAELTHQQPSQPSPLEREMIRITRIITVLAVAMGVAFFALGWGLGQLSLLESFLFALGIIVANVPEGLLPTISLSLAIGVRRMAARNAIVKRLERVEALGAVTAIVTDKTGTLTHNQMTVRGLWCGGQTIAVSGAGYEPVGEFTENGLRATDLTSITELLRTAALCCDARLLPPNAERTIWTAVGDPTEAALLTAAQKAGIDDGDLAHWPRLAELPFDSIRKRMTTLQQSGDAVLACTKGAPSEVLPRCSHFAATSPDEAAAITAEHLAQVEAAARSFADRGWRVLAVAQRNIPAETVQRAVHAGEAIETDLTLLGLVAMEDPPRAEVAPAVATCRRAGIRIIMATGDDGHTAAAIGREIGLVGERVHLITGRELDHINDRALGLLLGRHDVLFARVTPAQKLRLVEALQRRGEVVAVTGDGVNDAPALKRADVGVAMGASGTDVARAAADVILLDDNFATIVAAIEEGRAVYENVRKFVTYIFASNMPEIVPFIAFVLLRIPLPLSIMQILAVDLGTDILPALALGVEPPEPDIMRRPPRSRDEPLLDRATLLRAYAWLGAIEAALGLAGFFFVYVHAGWTMGTPMADEGPLYVMATTMSLAGIVAVQLGNGLACRSDHRSLFSLGVFTNRALLAAMAAEIIVLLALIYIPPLADVFQLAPLEPIHWLALAAFGPTLLAAEEARKWLAAWRRHGRKSS